MVGNRRQKTANPQENNVLDPIRVLTVLIAAAVWSEAQTLPQVDAPATTQPGEAATAPADVGAAELVRAAAKDNRLAFRTTEPGELIKLLGEPKATRKERDGDMDVHILTWPGVAAVFVKPHESAGEFTLFRLGVMTSQGGPEDYEEVDIGNDRPVVLRIPRDLENVDRFWGLAGMSLEQVDLREQTDLLRKLTFDTRTVWPAMDKLPGGFEPAKLLEDGKNPGLGVRGLHRRGIDGRGVHVAIIDQPLLLDHQEYAGHIERYELIDTYDVRTQMHGPPVASVLIGRTCGVAPAAILSFYAVPSWKRDNAPYAEALERILDHNDRVAPADRIRVVSISTGMFPQQAHLERWQEALDRAGKAGLLVITCERSPSLYYKMANRVPTEAGGSQDPDDPASFELNTYGRSPDALGVPAGGRTTASHFGPGVYTYWSEGGMSWCTPYLAGVAALGFQVDPELSPQRALLLLKETATRTAAGTIVNPPGFVDAVRQGQGPR